MKTTTEFKVGKHGIGWISDTFAKRVGISEFEKSVMPRVHTLQRNMTDAEIENEITKGQYASLGDVLAVLDSTDPVFKDGNWNLFYFPSCVVDVDWYSGDRGWHVGAWDRGGSGWNAGGRVLSPATSNRLNFELDSSESLERRVEKIEKILELLKQSI